MPDSGRFEAMFAAHYAAVVRYAMRRVGPDAAAEIVSETFLVAWRRRADVPDNALPWLYATARRVIANELRRQRRSRAFATRSQPGQHAADPADIVGGPLHVLAALARLGNRDQEVLRLHAWEQLDAHDAAQALGCSAAAYKVRLHRARRRLAALLEADAGASVPVPEKELS
jgi:RNA polymerase sigma-70 factor (ECF subfamily)